MNRNVELLKEAIANNEIKDFILGSKKKYYLVSPYADMPTDPDQVFDAFKLYYLSYSDDSIWFSFENATIELTQTSQGVWLCLYYLSMYLSYKKYSRKDFINVKKVIQNIEVSLANFKTELIKNKQWGGRDFQNGLWDDANRLINILNNKFQLDIKIEN